MQLVLCVVPGTFFRKCKNDRLVCLAYALVMASICCANYIPPDL